MAHKKKHGGPIPPGNQPHAGPPDTADAAQAKANAKSGAPFQEQDPKRRLGDYDGAGEHALEQPDGKNGANH